MDAGVEEDMRNMIIDVFLEHGRPLTVSELASRLKVNKDSVQQALFYLKETGFVAQRNDRWLMCGSPEDIDEGAACSAKRPRSPEEKLQDRPVGQKEYSNSVVPVMNRGIVSARPNVSTVGSSNMEIETRQTLQCAQLSDPGVREVHDNMKSILAFLAKSGGVEAKDVSKNCNLGNSRKGANPLLYFLEKKKLVICEQVGTSQKKIWKIGTRQPSEQEVIEMAAERSGVKTEAGGSSITAKSGPELHLHNHYHHHTHKNFVQVGENNTMFIPEELEKHKRVFERSAEDGVK